MLYSINKIVSSIGIITGILTFYPTITAEAKPNPPTREQIERCALAISEHDLNQARLENVILQARVEHSKIIPGSIAASRGEFLISDARRTARAELRASLIAVRQSCDSDYIMQSVGYAMWEQGLRDAPIVEDGIDY